MSINRFIVSVRPPVAPGLVSRFTPGRDDPYPEEVLAHAPVHQVHGARLPWAQTYIPQNKYAL